MKVTVVKVSQSKNGNWWITAKETEINSIGLEKSGRVGVGKSAFEPDVEIGQDISDLAFVSNDVAENDEDGIIYYLRGK